MATTVSAAFNKFLTDIVNLDPEVSKMARNSREWLRDQLNGFSGRYQDFPLHYADKDIDFGSFARRTKIRELDDVDLIHCLFSEGATYLDNGSYLTITPAIGTRLARFCNDDGQLNSIRVLNKFKIHLDEIPQYQASEIKRVGEAVSLNLTSYQWSFDIVPGFFTTPETDGRTYYIIPNGSGHWKKTDPRIDRDRVTRINQDHNGRVLNVVRAMKYWNQRRTAPGVPSYLFECLVLNAYENSVELCSGNLGLEIAKALNHIYINIFNPVFDPKMIDGNLNFLTFDLQQKISVRAYNDLQKAIAALESEFNQNDHQSAIDGWNSILGPAFPKYG